MTGISLHAGRETHFGWGDSPFVDGYRGLGRDGRWDCDDAPSTGCRESTQQQAMSDIMKAAHTHDPQRRAEFLRKALASLEGNGVSDPIPDQDAAAGGTPAPENTSMPAPMPTSTSDQTACDPTCTPGGCNTPPACDGLQQSGNSVNTGEYTITASKKDDGSLTITNNVTHQTTEVWGDPHVKVNGQNIAQFQKDDLNIQLQDGTVVHIQPTATNSKGVSHIAQVSITKGNQAMTMGGTGTNGFANGVATSHVMNDGHLQNGLYNTPSATDVTLGADGNLYYNNANGSMGGEIKPTASGGQTDLDGAGGGLVRDPSVRDASAGDPSTTASSGNAELEQRLLGILAREPMTFYSTMMMQQVQHLMSQQRSQSV